MQTLNMHEVRFGFNLANGTDTAARHMNTALSTATGLCCIVYAVDILIDMHWNTKCLIENLKLNLPAQPSFVRL